MQPSSNGFIECDINGPDIVFPMPHLNSLKIFPERQKAIANNLGSISLLTPKGYFNVNRN